ncbi:MAG: hypothetical protein WD030_05460 [Pirellulales bacterium]
MAYQEENSTGPFATVLICMLMAVTACASASWWLRELAAARRLETEGAALITADGLHDLLMASLANTPRFAGQAELPRCEADPVIETTAARSLPRIAPITEAAVQGVGWQVLLTPEPTGERAPTEPAESPKQGAAPSEPAEPVEPVDEVRTMDSSPAPQVEPLGQAFAVPRRLQQRLELLATDADLHRWTEPILSALATLAATTDASDPAVASALEQLRTTARQAERHSRLSAAPQAQSEVRRVGYAIQRRLAVWDSIHATAMRLHVAQRSPAASPLQQVSVVLDSLEERSEFDPPPLPPLHLADAELYGDLIDSQHILQKLEEYELSRRPSLAREMAAYRVLFAASATPEARRLDDHIESYYRNANFRVAVTEELLDRMLPQPEPFGRRVNDYVLGVPVHGYSTTMTRLNARLVPDPYRFHLRLEARGVVRSETSARSAPATLYSRGDTQFLTSKELIVSRQGLRQTSASADAENHSRLLRVRSDYDEVPLIGSLVRRFAREEHDKRRGEANREVEYKVSTEASRQFDRQVGPLVGQAESTFREELLGRCASLGIEPLPVELHTSDKRLTARLRFAAGDQLAAHTPRPRAPSDSLFSMQLHESALNNVLQQLDLDGRRMTMREVYTEVATRLGADDATPPDDIPEDVMVTFAPKNSLQVHFTDGAMRLTIALSRIEQKRNRWTNLVVRAYYEPQGDGLHAELVRTSGMELIGDRINTRSQVILRGVFAKVLDNTRTLPLVPKRLVEDGRLGDLEVTQLAISDGWLGVAVGPKQAIRRDEDNQATFSRWRLAYQQQHGDRL